MIQPGTGLPVMSCAATSAASGATRTMRTAMPPNCTAKGLGHVSRRLLERAVYRAAGRATV